MFISADSIASEFKRLTFFFQSDHSEESELSPARARASLRAVTPPRPFVTRTLQDDLSCHKSVLQSYLLDMVLPLRV